MQIRLQDDSERLADLEEWVLEHALPALRIAARTIAPNLRGREEAQQALRDLPWAKEKEEVAA